MLPYTATNNSAQNLAPQFFQNKNSSALSLHIQHYENVTTPVHLGLSTQNKGDFLSLLRDDDPHPLISPHIDFFASHFSGGAFESEVYYTSNPIPLEQDFYFGQHHMQLESQFPMCANPQAALCDQSRQQQIQQEAEDINPMFVFDSYCIPENFFEAKKQNEGFKVQPHGRRTDGPMHSIDYYRRAGKFRINTGNSQRRTIEQSKDYDKNICRYIARLLIRQFNSQDYTEHILEQSKCDNDTLEDAREVFLKQIENISGHRAFRELLIIKSTDSEETIEHKCIFKRFCQWFLLERAVRYIIQGDMKDKVSYIRYQNDIMLYYIDCPEKWESNKCSRQRRLARN